MNENTWKIDFEYSKSFEYRIDNMVSLINLNEVNSVMDLGAGHQTLRRKIPSNIEYIPCDIYKHVDSNIIVDFNKGEFYNKKVDVVFCSGIFEYIYDLKQFIKNISKNTNILIGSYHFKNDIENRPDIWVNSYNITDFFKIWHDLGFTCAFLDKFNYFNNIFQDYESYERIFIITDNTKNNIINYSVINKVLLQKIYQKIEATEISNVKTINILEKLIDTLAWWIPIKKWRDNFRNKFFDKFIEGVIKVGIFAGISKKIIKINFMEDKQAA